MVGTLPTPIFLNACKKKSTTFHLPCTHCYINCLNKSGEASLDMAPASLTSETFPTASTVTSTGTNSTVNNYVLYIKCSVALAGLNKLETQSTNQDIAELANFIQFNLN